MSLSQYNPHVRWAKHLDHRFFAQFIYEMFEARKDYWGAHYKWHYMRFKQTDQYFEDLPDQLGCYCMGGEI